MRTLLYRGDAVASANINVRTESELKSQAAQVFESLGLDMSTAVNMFLRQTVKYNDLPFVIGTQAGAASASQSLPHGSHAKRPPFNFGGLTGAFKMSDSFNDPLDDFAEYSR
jgi:DNA-damage-inducible protein J